MLAAALVAAAGVGLLAAIQPPHLAVAPPGAVLSGVHLVEPAGRRLRDVTVVVRGERIAEIRAGVAGEEPSFACTGCFVLPGLIDLHVHQPPALAIGQRELFGLLFLAHGVTSVRDAGTLGSLLASEGAGIDQEPGVAPRTFGCGRILDGDPPVLPGARSVREPAEAARAVDELAARGAACVKVYDGVSEAVLRAIQDAAGRRGLRVVAHVPREVPFERLAGIEVQHLMGLHGSAQGPSLEAIHAYAAHSKAAGISHVPTLVAFARGARAGDRALPPEDPAVALLPRFYRELLWNPGRNPLVFLLEAGGSWSSLGARLAAMKLAVRALHEGGVEVLAGSDTMSPLVVPGASLLEEIRLLAAAGLSAEEALAAATTVAATHLPEARLARLEEGAPADLAIFRSDPTRDLAALDTLVAVVVRGRLYERADLLAAASRQRAHFEGPLYAGLFELAARAMLAARSY